MRGPRVQDCVDCDGVGSGLAEDYDDEGLITRHRVACEGCSGCGRLAGCMHCGESMPLVEAEREGAYCLGCRVALDRRDAEAERAHLRRWPA